MAERLLFAVFGACRHAFGFFCVVISAIEFLAVVGVAIDAIFATDGARRILIGDAEEVPIALAGVGKRRFVASRAIDIWHVDATPIDAFRSASFVARGKCPNETLFGHRTLRFERQCAKCLLGRIVIVPALAIDIAFVGAGLETIPVFGWGVGAYSCATIAHVNSIIRFALRLRTRKEAVIVAKFEVWRPLTNVAHFDIFEFRGVFVDARAVGRADFAIAALASDAFAGDARLARSGARRFAVACRVRFVDAFAVLANFFVFASARYRTRIGIDAMFVIAHLAIATFGIADAFFDFIFIDALAVLTNFRFICAWICVVAFGFVDAFFVFTNFCLICAWICVVAFGLRFARLLCVTKPAFANDTRIAWFAVGNFIDANAIVAILIAIATWHGVGACGGIGAGSIEAAVTTDAFIVCGTRFAICLFGCWRRFIDAFAVIASLIIVDTWFCRPTLGFGNAKAILTNIASVAISMIRARFGVVGSRTTRR